MVKKSISLFLSIVLIASVLFVPTLIYANAYIGETLTSSDGLWGYCRTTTNKYRLIDYYGTNKAVAIPETIDGIKMSELYLGDINNTLESITIPKVYSNIKGLYDCKNLQEIYFSRDYEAGKGPELGDSCFAELKKLKKVVLPNELKEIMLTHSKTELGGASYKGAELPSSCFSDCTSLTDITWPTNITDIGSSAFEGCTSLKELIIPDGVKVCYESFVYKCSNIKTLVVPDSLQQFLTVEILDFPKGTVHTNKKNTGIETIISNVALSDPVTAQKERQKADTNLVYSPPVTNIKGDTNGDGEVNISDATLIQKWAANIFEYMEYNCKYMRASIFDFNGDGNSNVKDATALQKFLVGKE